MEWGCVEAGLKGAQKDLTNFSFVSSRFCVQEFLVLFFGSCYIHQFLLENKF